jgi:hypothetical protein
MDEKYILATSIDGILSANGLDSPFYQDSFEKYNASIIANEDLILEMCWEYHKKIISQKDNPED